MLQLFAVFHLNLAFSSIEEEQRPLILKRCYWPLLEIAERHGLPIGIEASGYTLDAVAALDQRWVDKLRQLVSRGPCELIGSGYAQLIGPLVPAEVNAANQRLGLEAYQRLLGQRPTVAYVNEQAYSAGLLEHYVAAGYQALVMEWDNPAHTHPDWNSEWQYFPQIAAGQHGEMLPVIWNRALAFQQFQRYAHGESSLDEYLQYLKTHDSDRLRAFSFYGNDVEIFDFRPGRYRSEAALSGESEWTRIEKLFVAVKNDPGLTLTRPSDVLELLGPPSGGNRIQLESADVPIPVKKQPKYNITRWAVTGRGDLAINTACWRIYTALCQSANGTDDDWRELCGLWASDFRTHITERRWLGVRERLARFEGRLSSPRHQAKTKAESSSGTPEARVERSGKWLDVSSDRIKVRLNCSRGLAIDGLWIPDLGEQSLCGTLRHGFYDDIRWGADFYTGMLVFEAPGRPKLTDLEAIEPEILKDADGNTVIRGQLETEVGVVRKALTIGLQDSSVTLAYELDWPEIPVGSLRLGDVTLHPGTFDQKTLFYRCHNGGRHPETFSLGSKNVTQGQAVSFLVSASHGVGMTEGWIELGDAHRVVRVEVDKCSAALIGLITYQQIRQTYFYRLTLSAAEVDDTRKPYSLDTPLTCRIRVTGSRR